LDQLGRGLVALAFSLASSVAWANCEPLPPDTDLPLTIDALTVQSDPPGGRTSRAPSIIFFNGLTLVIQKDASVAGLAVTLMSGSVGPVDVVEKDAANKVIRSSLLPTQSPAGPGEVTFNLFTGGSTSIVMKSRNNEGGLMRICTISN
jgi:hypothetical protein